MCPCMLHANTVILSAAIFLLTKDLESHLYYEDLWTAHKVGKVCKAMTQLECHKRSIMAHLMKQSIMQAL